MDGFVVTQPPYVAAELGLALEVVVSEQDGRFALTPAGVSVLEAVRAP